MGEARTGESQSRQMSLARELGPCQSHLERHHSHSTLVVGSCCYLIVDAAPAVTKRIVDRPLLLLAANKRHCHALVS
jgi:hypothetical protein